MMNIPNVAIVEGPEGKPVAVGPDIQGYNELNGDISPEAVDKFNRSMGLTDDQVRAMKIGSMFGWDCPAVVEAFAQ